MSPSTELFSAPTECPVCGHPTVVEGDFLYCRNKSCSSKLFGAVKVWINRLGLLFWGDAMVESMTNPNSPNSVKSMSDIYRMSVEDIAEHCSGIKMARKCWDNLHDNSSVPLEVVLAGLNISNLGLTTSTEIVKAGYDSVDSILAITLEQLVMIPNVGTITAQQIRTGLDEKCGLLTDLASVLTIKKSASGVLNGLKICITGDTWAPRKTVQRMIVSEGGQAMDGVSKDTSILVCNDAESSSSKNKRAKSYGIPVISGNELKGILDGTTTVQEVLSGKK